MKVRSSNAFLASHRKECKNIHVVALDTCDVAFKLSTQHLVSSFWYSGHLFLPMQFISEFI